MSHVVQQTGQGHERQFVLRYIVQIPAVTEDGETAPGEMIGSYRVLKPRVVRRGIDQKGVAQLPHVTQALERLRIEHGQRTAIYLDVIPERIADNRYSVGRHYPVRRVVRPRSLPA